MAARPNLSYIKSCELFLPSDNKPVHLILVGCGGTGSWLSLTVARIARLLYEVKGKTVQTIFIDPDHVEPKNVYRQYFSDLEIGNFKAETLAFRLSTALGVNITAITEKFDPDHRSFYNLEGTVILIGCVDNPQARKSLHKFASSGNYQNTKYYLDAGNWKTSGQVLLGGGRQDEKPFPMEGICTRLPLPATQHPELIDESHGVDTEAAPEAAHSCADLALRGSQSLGVNQTVASIAGHYLISMLLTGELRTFQTYFDLPSGTMSSTYILPKTVRALLRAEKEGGA
jgi:PRTRC genetic system ThiF family protein